MLKIFSSTVSKKIRHCVWGRRQPEVDVPLFDKLWWPDNLFSYLHELLLFLIIMTLQREKCSNSFQDFFCFGEHGFSIWIWSPYILHVVVFIPTAYPPLTLSTHQPPSSPVSMEPNHGNYSTIFIPWFVPNLTNLSRPLLPSHWVPFPLTIDFIFCSCCSPISLLLFTNVPRSCSLLLFLKIPCPTISAIDFHCTDTIHLLRFPHL